MHSLKAYLMKIRLKQVSREIAALGPIYSIIVLFVLTLFIKVAAVSLITLNSQLTFCLIWSILLLTIHFSRKDIPFLKRTQKNEFIFLLSDYILLSVIPISLLIYCHGFVAALLIIMVITTICVIPPIQKSQIKTNSEIKFIPDYLPEWKSGIRKVNKYIFLSLILLAIIASPLPYFSLFICWLLTAIITGFYQIFEPRDQLRFHHASPKKYLNSKIKNGIKYYLLLVTPIIIAYTIMHHNQLIISFAALSLFLILLAFTIISKYAYYQPVATTGPHQIYLTIGLISFIIPFMVPVPFVLTLTHYRKAIKRLTPYFYDSAK